MPRIEFTLDPAIADGDTLQRLIAEGKLASIDGINDIRNGHRETSALLEDAEIDEEDKRITLVDCNDGTVSVLTLVVRFAATTVEDITSLIARLGGANAGILAWSGIE